MDDTYDVIIIGSGAGGGTLAYRLAASGKRILILERGGRLPREQDNWNAKAVFVDFKYQPDETWLDAKDKKFKPGNHYYVGGNTKVYGAALFRLRERDFTEVRHAGGISPAWPMTYADLAPYYLQAESIYHVHGKRGDDPYEPPENSPYPHPAVSHEPRIERLCNEFKAMGLRPFSLPMGVMLDEANPRTSPCIRCATCDGFPCLVHAKADAEVACVDRALLQPNVSLMTDAYVERVETSATGREATGVVVRIAGEERRLRGAFVVVACGAINTAALLLRSTSDLHPHGLANSSGAVGRHYMCHNNSAMLALSAEPNPTVFQKTLGLNDWYYESEAWEYPMGHVQMLGKSTGTILMEHAPSIAPGFALNAMANHSLDFWLTTEDLPAWDNRVELRSDGGIKLNYTANNTEAHDRLKSQLRMSLAKIGGGMLLPNGIRLAQKIPLSGVAHQVGTARFGHDPSASVLDVNCKTHDLDNVYVVDGSFFPSISAVNPGLTIMANALRVGDHLLGRLS